MAEGILKDLILDEVDRHHSALPIDVMSAGIHAVEGLPASRFAVEVAAEHGISLRFHRSRQLTPALIRSADLILTMENFQTEHILRNAPDTEKVYELQRYGRGQAPREHSGGIADPMGGGLDEYRKTFDTLREEIVRITGILFPLIRDTYHLA
jgi:protein-tyrosine-phosphatase